MDDQPITIPLLKYIYFHKIKLRFLNKNLPSYLIKLLLDKYLKCPHCSNSSGIGLKEVCRLSTIETPDICIGISIVVLGCAPIIRSLATICNA